jgi:NitT/TauT family transport system substrate-binding protein
MMNRRGFIGALAAGGAATLGGARPRSAGAEPPPETTRIRLFKWRSICVTPQFIAEDLLKTEGFTDVQYIQMPGGLGGERLLADGDIDINSQFSAPLIVRIDAGAPVVFLGGLHVGCFELFANETVRAIPDLRGKIVAVPELGSVQHVFLSAILAYVGLDPRRDVKFVTPPPEQSQRLLADRRIDAYLGFPPDPQELRAKKIGHVVLNSTQDRPWSQYFCCMVAANREFVRKHPIATKRALRALLKANEVCALDPEGAARRAVDRGFAARYDYTLETVKSIPYGKWREYSPEDTIRFYALRLHEAGMIKSPPQKILSQGSDWRFLNELKKELKG